MVAQRWRLNITVLRLLLFVSYLHFSRIFIGINGERHKSDATAVSTGSDSLLVFATLDGTLYGVDKRSGNTLWSLKDKPPIDNPDPSQGDSGSSHLYLPDPVDGSLYVSGPRAGLKRLPLTIPELVGISPCHSSDGLLYSATKQDSWIAIDSSTGDRLYTFSSSNGMEETCPLNERSDDTNILHIPQTVYRVAVMDSVSKQVRWNVSFTQYGSPAYSNRLSQDLLHFCSSSDGSVLSVNALTGANVWQKEFDSPVVGAYSSEGFGNLRKVPITSVGLETLKAITGSSALAFRMETACLNPSDALLKSSLFVGVQSNQPYAMKSLIEETRLQGEFPPIVPLPPLLDGPDKPATSPEPSIANIGHYVLPDDIQVQLQPLFQQIANKPTTTPTIIPPVDTATMSTIIPSNLSIQSNNEGGVVSISASVMIVMVVTVVFSTLLASLVAIVVTRVTSKQNDIIQVSSVSPSPENSKTGSSLQMSENVSGRQSSLSHSSSNGSPVKPSESTNSSNYSSHKSDSNRRISIGKISYCVQDVLGKGSQGTVVFRGTFDSRNVAVKRIIPECFELADREVALLRESDQHPNVVRYFCMEEDSTFRYLALELCHASLYEYVQGHKLNEFPVDEIRVLWEAMSGLKHLHDLGIVHRDVKPHNVLLTVNSNSGTVKTLISDFGLCRKLPSGRGSFTAQSGILGTEGWIAPEMFQNQSRVTCAVDIFAMGCVIYYVLSRGSHPFGPPLKRQSNIEIGDYNLHDLLGSDRHTVEHLVNLMISFNYNFRPSAQEVLSHCLFWSPSKQLAFFQDVSDRIEKETPSSRVLQSLERGGGAVVKGDWKNHITEDLRQDLMKFRSYQSSSVRDLLRAMRNKKHHYRELSEGLRQSLGSIPDQYVNYFTSRFPLLLIHTYKQMEICKSETVFQPYYFS